ncbi:MAG: protein kinase [Corynebacteriales bacterium]|nr:protein kinase [Mycobacteriales bacterium]
MASESTQRTDTRRRHVAVRPLGPSDPSHVGQYQVLAELGRGGMGRVLLGGGPDGRLVALKLVHEQFAQDDGFRTRFKREVEASSSVSGAYTAAVVDADADARTPWLASVFVPGPSLHEALTTVGALPEKSVLRLAAGLATALIQIHRSGLVHRDLKPSNVLLTDDGPRVIDFGIVRAIDGEGASELTRAGWLIGSPAFMSPEQAKGEKVTQASDVFSLGCIVVAAAVGASPFADAATLHTLNNVVQSEPDLSALPTLIRRTIEPCLAKDPAKRPTPEKLLESIGQIAPSARPWPASVHELIAQRHTEIAQLLDPSEKPTMVADADHASNLPKTKIDGPAGVPPTRVDHFHGSSQMDSSSQEFSKKEVKNSSQLPKTRVDAGPLNSATGHNDKQPALAPRDLMHSAQASSGAPWLRFGAVLIALLLVSAITWKLWPSKEEDPKSPRDTSSAPESTPQLTKIGAPMKGAGAAGSVVFSSDGATLASIYADDTVQLWDVATQQQVGQILGPVPDLQMLQFSPDASTLLGARIVDSDEAEVHIWDVPSGHRTSQTFVSDSSVETLAFSPNGQTVAIDTWGEVELWDIASHQRIGIIEPEDKSVGAPLFSPDGRTLVTGMSDDPYVTSALAFWDVSSLAQIGNLIYLPEQQPVERFSFSPDGNTLITASEKESPGYIVRLWDVQSQNQLRQPMQLSDADADDVLYQVTLSPDEKTLGTINNGHLRLWNLTSGKESHHVEGTVYMLAMSPDGSKLATAGKDHSVQLWRVP